MNTASAYDDSANEPSADEILHALACGNSGCICQKSVQRGHGLTHCPVHADHTPSFNVSLKDGTVLVHCQSGVCTQEQLIDALQERNLWPKQQRQERPVRKHIVAEYNYHDLHGKLLYQAVRLGPVKDFRQRRPDGKGDWIWNLSGVERVLYRLPELLAADPQRWRIIVEGEKDVDSLTRLGFVATSNVGGAGKWLPQYSKWFQNCRVCLICDNDEKGRDHMTQVARSLNGIADMIVWLELPGVEKKGDVTDWLESGGDADKLKSLILSAPVFEERQEQEELPPEIALSNQQLEMYMIYTCAHLRETVQYLQPEDFTSSAAQSMFRAIRAGEVIDADGLTEPPDSYNEWDTISLLRDLSRRRAALKIVDYITRVVTDTSKVFNPCIPADALNALCEHSTDKTNSVRLSDVLDLK